MPNYAPIYFPKSAHIVVKAAYFYFITEFGVFERRHLVVILGIIDNIETKVNLSL